MVKVWSGEGLGLSKIVVMVEFHSDSRNEKSESVQTLFSVIQADKTDGFLHQTLRAALIALYK